MLEKLHQYKKESGKSWYRIAKDLNLPEPTVYNWAAGYYNPCNYHCKLIKKYLAKQSR